MLSTAFGDHDMADDSPVAQVESCHRGPFMGIHPHPVRPLAATAACGHDSPLCCLFMLFIIT